MSKEYMPYSVLMSVYYKEKAEYFVQAVESMLNQTMPPDDFVIVCDGPLTVELDKEIEILKNKHPDLFQIVRLKENKGLGNALNEGLYYCKNELVARMDSDDISFLDRIEKQLDFIEKNPELSVTGGQIVEFEETPEIIKTRRVVPCEFNDVIKRLKTRNPVNHVTTVFKKNDVISVGGYIEVKGFEDYHLWTRILLSGRKIENIPDDLCYVRTEKNMFERRGGKKYFENTIKMEKFLYANKIINSFEYMFNLAVRYTTSVLFPSSIRKWFFVTFIRK